MNTRIDVLYHIRDAQGLTAKEKVFLFVTETRGEMYGHWERNRADMGLSKRGYYEALGSLLSKGLLTEVRRYNRSSVYQVDASAFPYGEQESHSGNDGSHVDSDGSHSGNGHSRSDETKGNQVREPKKKEREEELEGEQLSPEAAGASSVDSPKPEIKDDSWVTTDPPSLSPGKDEQSPDSHSGNEDEDDWSVPTQRKPRRSFQEIQREAAEAHMQGRTIMERYRKEEVNW